MHKSVLTFGVLVSSLVMLAIVPFLNNNVSNTAMAQGYNDNYYGDNSYYSQYPTDDKKYECRTGPFEGFFVSSVEFCKHVKFDDRKDHKNRDNVTGTQGPPGPQGPAGINGTTGATGAIGPQGPPGLNGTNGTNGINGTQGPPGITFLNSTNVYLNQSQVTSPPGQFATLYANAKCDPADFVVNGGWSQNKTGGGVVADFLFDRPFVGQAPQIGSPPGLGWEASALYNPIIGGSDRFMQLNVYVFCFDNPPLRP